MHRILLTIFASMLGLHAIAQCSLLSTTISVDFSADGICAPVTVNTFEVTYTFNAAQNPADVEIEFRWNDPGNTTETISGAGLVVSNGDRTFQATATPFPYPDTGPECFFEAQAFIIVANDVCETSEQTQIVPSWNLDNENGGVIAFDPGTYNVCENSEIVDAVFLDASTFNCNINDNPDNPNQISRWTQFVYGTDPAPAVGRIRDVSLEDGGTIVLTDNAGNIDNPQTRGTAGLMVTGGHFGLVEEVPFPADGPLYQTFPISAPANVANVQGSTFQITLYNWNTCNPYNNDPINPNYEDAVSEVLNITIIPPPAPSYIARDGGPGGTALAEFCINEDIYFDNLTAGGPYDYSWEFYDGPLDTDTQLGTSNNQNPTFSFATGGDKLVRLTASDGTADGVCEVIYEDLVTLSPDAVADFSFTDVGFASTIDPDFCQTGADVFTVGFVDNTTLVANTEVRYEFYTQGNPPSSGIPDSTQPTDGSYSTTNIPPFTRDFSSEEFVVVRLVALNTASACSSFDQDTVFVYGQPVPEFSTNEVCEGLQTSFSALTDQTNGFTTRVNDDEIATYEWDFSYDAGLGFNTELTRTNDSDFDWNIGTVITPEVEPVTSTAGVYEVALRTTSQKGMCSAIVSNTVVVNANPDSQLEYDVTDDLCPEDPVLFTNSSSNPTFTMQYFLEVSHTPSGYTISVTLTSVDTLLTFSNPDDSTRTYQAILRSTTEDLCETISSPLSFRVSPDEESGFTDENYNPFATNCSPWTSTLLVDQATQDLLADSYQWTLSDQNGIIDGYPVSKVSTDPDFHQLTYQLENVSNATLAVTAVLEVTKTGVCVANDTFNLQVSPQPAATFDVTRSEDCDEVVFELSATQKGLTNYAWTFDPVPVNEFGDDDERLISYTREATTGDDINPTITLVTTNLAGCPSEAEAVMETVEKRRPDITPDFILSSDTVQLPNAMVSITNTSTADVGFSYLWEFGDGTDEMVREPGTHTYTNFGSFLIRLTITDGFCEVETSKPIVVLPADPVIDFVADTLQGCTPLTIQFTNLSQNAVPGEFLWEFGDGSIAEIDNPIHTYFDDGEYDVRLRGTNNVGVTLENEKTDYIQAYGRPFADFLVSARVVYIPDQDVAFRNLSKDATTFFWDFGDGATSTDQNPRHAYVDEGFYDITLVATNELGCSDTLFRAAEIEAVVGGDVASPNAFTPNLSGPNGGVDGGGLNLNSVNDVFLPKLEGVTRFRMLIYNKWGQLLFQTEDKKVGWDGYYKGKLVPGGVYVYKLELRYSDGRDEIKAGDVTLIR